MRSACVQKMRPFADSDQEIWVRWYKVAPGAKVFPGVTAFGFPKWEPEPQDFEGPGILYEPRPHRPTNYPAPPGDHFEGRLDWFESGLPVGELAWPTELCGGPGIIAQGAVCACGTAWPPHAFHSQPAVLGGHAEDVAPLAPRVEHSSIVLSGGHPEDAPCIAIGAYWIAYDAAYYRLQCLPSGGTHSAEVEAGGHSADQHAVYTGAYDPDQFSSAWDVFRP